MATNPIYILGAGAVGMPLAVHLLNHGRKAIAVRTSSDHLDPRTVEVAVRGRDGSEIRAAVESVSLAKLGRIAGTVVVAAKTYANESIAARLGELEVAGPVVVLQNGIGVEDPYLRLEHARIYRCVLYVTGQKTGEDRYSFAPITASCIGVVRADEQELDRIVRLLDTPGFPFRPLENIQREVWKKAVINSVFNSICPLLEADNGIFLRSEPAARLAGEVVEECLAIAQRLGYDLTAGEILKQIQTISKGSAGQLISTLQDINSGRETEIDYLNLEIARRAAALEPPVEVPITQALGEMIKIKAGLRQK